MQDTSAAAAQASARSSAAIASQSVSLPLHSPSSSTMNVSPSPSLGQATSQVSTNTSFPVPPGLPGIAGLSASPGLAPSTPMTLPSAAVGSASSAVHRPTMPTRPASSPVVHQQVYPTYPSLPAMAASPPALWLQPPQLGGMPRTPFLPYPAVFSGTFPLLAHGIPHPSVSLPDSQPPGVIPAGTVSSNTMFSASSHQLVGTPVMQTELPPPGIGMLRV